MFYLYHMGIEVAWAIAMAKRVPGMIVQKSLQDAFMSGLQESAAVKLRSTGWFYVHVAEVVAGPRSPLKSMGFTVA